MSRPVLRNEPCVCCEFFPTPWNGKRFNIEGRLCNKCFWFLYGKHVRNRKQVPGPSCKLTYITCASCNTRIIVRNARSKKCVPCRALRRSAITRAWSRNYALTHKAEQAAAMARYTTRKAEGLPPIRIRFNQKLTPEVAIIIRTLYAQGTYKGTIAKKLGISWGAVDNVILGLTHDPVRTKGRYNA